MKIRKAVLNARNSTMVRRHDDSLILRTAALIILPLQLVFSIFLLLRGHDEPGGGFIGGLVASGAFSLYLFTFGIKALNRLFWVSPKDILSVGLILGLVATIPSIFLGQPFFTAIWFEFYLAGTLVKLSTVLIFDIGVYLAVIGTLMTMFTAIADVRVDRT
jgi:multicomponent Na+:H+ antiporter subunit B